MTGNNVFCLVSELASVACSSTLEGEMCLTQA